MHIFDKLFKNCPITFNFPLVQNTATVTTPSGAIPKLSVSLQLFCYADSITTKSRSEITQLLMKVYHYLPQSSIHVYQKIKEYLNHFMDTIEGLYITYDRERWT